MSNIDSEFIRKLDEDILNAIEHGYEKGVSESEFNDMAIRLFQFQYNANRPLQKYVQRKAVDPNGITSWEEIPGVVADVFKDIPLTCFPAEKAERKFMTSGTKNPGRRGLHYIDPGGMHFWRRSVYVTAKHYFFPDVDRIRILALSPPPETMPYDMSMAVGIGEWVKNFGTENSEFLARVGERGIDIDGRRFVGLLKESEKTGEPVAIVNSSFGLVHFLDQCKEIGMKFNLPEGSRSLDGGGYKGRSRELTKEELYSGVQETMGISEAYSVNLLGLTENATQFFDNVLLNKLEGKSEPRYKPNQPWTRTIAVNPETLERLPKGKIGLLRHYDLANRSSVMAVQTDDLGYEVGSGFEIIGRVKGGEPRGCSLDYNEFVIAQK